ncbi:MAG: hypothetical protein ACTHLN_07975 [Tepidisphaeraceae bacterium]
MRKMKSAVLVAILAAAGFARADVLESVPNTALAAVKVASLSKTSAKIAKLAKDYGIDPFVPQLQDPLASLKAALNISKGLNENGELGVAFFSPKPLGLTSDEAMLALIPVSDYAAFLTNFGDAHTDGDITEITLPNENKPSYLAHWGDYAALSPSQKLLAKPDGTLKPSGTSAKESARQDFLLYANFKKISPEVLPDLEKGLSKMLEEVDKNNQTTVDPKYKPLIKSAVTQAFAAAHTFLDNADTATFGLNISDAGLNYTLLSEFKPDSYLGKLASSIKNTDKPLTLGLPAVRYLAFGGSTIDPSVSMKVIDDLTQPVIAELKKLQGQEQVSKLVDTVHAALQANTGMTFGMAAPTKIGQEGIFQQVAVYRGAGPQFKQAFDEGGAFAKQTLADMKPVGDKPLPTIELKSNDRSIEGVNFNSIKIDAKPNPDDPSAAQMEQVTNMMYGADGLAYHYGVLDKDMILTVGASDATVGTFIKSLKANDDAVSKLDTVKAVAAELPKERILEYYLAVDEMVNTGVAAAGQYGMPLQLQLPPDLPPFGFTFASDGTALRMDAHIPTTTVQSLIAAGMQMYMQFQGGQGGGGNL